MKKFITVLLALSMLFAIVPLGTAAEEATVYEVVEVDGINYANLSLGKEYTLSGGSVYATYEYSDHDKNNKLLYKLTDGNASYNGVNGFIAGYSGADTSAVVDLGEVKTVNGVKTDLWGDNWGLGLPQNNTVEFSYSTNGTDYTSLGTTEKTVEDHDSWTGCFFTVVSETPVQARYIKVRYSLKGLAIRFASEITVFGKGVIKEQSHDVLELNGVKYLKDFGNGSPIENVLSAFGSKNVTIGDKTTGLIATGDVITAGTDSYTAIVIGDVNSNGKVDARDYIDFRLMLIGKKTLDSAETLAADIDNDGEHKAVDYLKIRKYLVGLLKDLYIKPTLPGFTSPVIENYVSTTVNKTANGVTFTAATSQQSGFKTTLSMQKMGWGTWNLGYFDVTNVSTGKTVRMNPGSTDWEYVYQTSQSGSNFSFTGGNHDDEKLRSIAFYDAKTGALLGEGTNSVFTATANGVKIIEKTTICFQACPEDRTPDDNWFGEEFVYVTRTYIINGVDIWLECDYDFITTGYMKDGSYTGMYCADKSVGNNIVFNNIDGTTTSHKTNLSGTAAGDSRGNKAASVEIWGDTNPNHRMHVEVYDVDVMCDNFKTPSGTFYWDMNSSQNKLYFSKFNQATLIPEGTHWDTLIRWSFYYKQ